MHLIGDVFAAFVAVLKVLVKSQVSVKSSFFLFFLPRVPHSFLRSNFFLAPAMQLKKKTESVKKISACPETSKILVKSKKNWP